ncbi:alpha/beta fold hydrolase [Nocardioides immobilis]|nr:alpha/beta fold hydrolase [Nocardioides immobilis]
MKRAVAVLVVIAAAAAPGPLGRSDAVGDSSQRVPTFHPIACPDGVFPDDRVVDCGYVVVPEDRREPNGRLIRVAAAVVHATSPDPGEPIVFLGGGPSFGAISDFALGGYFADWATAEEHDLVLVDTRGTGISRPRLGCRELDRAEVRAFYAGRFVNSEALRIFGHALDRCWERYTERGIDLADYNTHQSAADLEALRRALGYDQWNLLAVSADGTLGLTYMRRFPGGIRSAIIDSGMAPNALWGLDYHVGTVRILNRVFAGCRANAACRSTYPGLRRLFERKSRQLKRDPVVVTIPRMRPEPVRLLVDEAGIYSDAISLIYPGDQFSPSQIPGVLAFAWKVAHGHLKRPYRRLLGTGPMENSHSQDFLAGGKTMSYVCRDNVRFITWEDRREAADAAPPFARRFLRRGFDLAAGNNDPRSPAGCRHWPVGRAGHRQHELVVSAIPTLVLANRYDLAVPPRMVRPMLPGLSRSTYVVLPAAFHLSLAFFTNGNECAREIATDFLVSPETAPDTSCVDSLPRLDYTPRRTTSPLAPGCSDRYGPATGSRVIGIPCRDRNVLWALTRTW